MMIFGMKAGWQPMTLAAALAALSLLAGCTSAAESAGSPSVRPSDAAPSHESIAKDRRDSSASIPAGAEPVVSLPDQDVYLYASPQKDALLAIGDARQSMDWTYSTVRGVLPALKIGDYDRDGEDELAVVLELGSGTGLLQDELHVVEFRGMNGTADRPFIDHTFRSEDYLAQLDAALTFRKVEQDGKWRGQIAIGGRAYEVDLSPWVKEYGVETIQDRLGYGAIVYFEADDAGQLHIKVAVGLRIDKLVEPQYIGYVKAKVSYADGAFKLEQYAFAADE